MSATPSFPVDLPGGPTGQDHALRWTSILIGVAALTLTLTNATSIYSWGTDLTPGPRVAQFLDRADRWRATADRAGLGSPRARMRGLWTRLEEARWPGDEADDRQMRG